MPTPKAVAKPSPHLLSFGTKCLEWEAFSHCFWAPGESTLRFLQLLSGFVLFATNVAQMALEKR